jgi:ankyrin repeat protein
MAAIESALEAFYRGDRERLARLLDDDPELVRARVEGVGGHYCGYFHRATLLHHVAGNPLIQRLPPNGPDLAATILERGADVDAVTAPGPSQPHDIGWTTLGLVASSNEARKAGQQRALLELLVAHGADLDARAGGALMGALYYDEPDAARFLVERGAAVDLVAAAGLGRVDLMESFVGRGGDLAAGAHRLVHYSQCRDRPGTDDEVLCLALVYAAMGGHRDAAVWLLERGADPRARARFDHAATALHWAALRGHRDLVELLLERGADPSLRDETYDAAARGWAEHAGHTAVAALFPG